MEVHLQKYFLLTVYFLYVTRASVWKTMRINGSFKCLIITQREKEQFLPINVLLYFKYFLTFYSSMSSDRNSSYFCLCNRILIFFVFFALKIHEDEVEEKSIFWLTPLLNCCFLMLSHSFVCYLGRLHAVTAVTWYA